MPRKFSHSTAEQLFQIVEAIQVTGKSKHDFLETFCDFSSDQVINGTELAVDMGLLIKDGDCYKAANGLIRFFSTPVDAEKAAILRVVLENYEPFIIFRQRLMSTNSADTAAQQTKTMLDLDAHREEVKDTLISLGTYSRAFSIEGGGRYSISTEPLSNELESLASACEDLSAAEVTIRRQIGERADLVNRTEVIEPLAHALRKASAHQASDAVRDAAEAIESFLSRLGARMGLTLTGADGIIQLLEKFRPGNHLPKKIIESAKYLGQLRNAADHGVDNDPDVGALWHIQNTSGLQYVFVACSFISACLEREAGGDFII